MPVVFSQSFINDPPDTRNHARIGYINYLRGRNISHVTATTPVNALTPADAPLRPDTWEFYQPNAASASWECTFAQARTIDYVAIAGHTFGTRGATVLVEVNTGSFVAFASYTAIDNQPVMFIGLPVANVTAVRVTISGASAPVRFATVWAGQSLIMQRRIYGGHAPMNLSPTTEVEGALTDSGQFLGQRIVRTGEQGSASWQHITPGWYRLNFAPFVQHASSLPFFFAWRPWSYPDQCSYCKSSGDIQPHNMGIGKGLMSVDIRMEGLGYG